MSALVFPAVKKMSELKSRGVKMLPSKDNHQKISVCESLVYSVYKCIWLSAWILMDQCKGNWRTLWVALQRLCNLCVCVSGDRPVRFFHPSQRLWSKPFKSSPLFGKPLTVRRAQSLCPRCSCISKWTAGTAWIALLSMAALPLALVLSRTLPEFTLHFNPVQLCLSMWNIICFASQSRLAGVALRIGWWRV